MKKKIVLISLLSASLISVSLVSVFAGKRNGNLDTIVRAGKPSGRHYPGIEATETCAGLREYWTNCDGYTTTSEPYNIADYADMTVADSQAVLADLLANSPSDSRIINAHEHYDINFDYFCDEPGCEYEFEGIESISISCLTTYIGSGESVVLKANVEAHGDVSTEVEWSLSAKSPSMFILVDNKDGTATLTGADFTGTSSYSATITATSVFDPLVSSAGKLITVATYGDGKRSTLNGYFGEGKWQLIPYFVSTNFTDYGRDLYAYSTSRTLKDMVNSFDNQGLWTKVYATSLDAKYTLVDSGNLYELILDGDYYKSGKYYGEFTISKFEIFDTFPTSEIESIVEHLDASGEVPSFDDANFYRIDGRKLICFTDNASEALASYQSTLELAGWFEYDEECYAKIGETLLIYAYVEDSEFVLSFDVADSPVTKPITSWPAQTVAEALGDLTTEKAVAANGSTFKVVSSAANTITVQVNGGSDSLYIQSLLAAGYSLVEETYYRNTYESSSGTLTVVVEKYSEGWGYFNVILTAHLPAGVSTEFPMEEVQKIIGKTEKDNIVAASGTKFELEIGDSDYDVTVTVTGGNKNEFISALTSAGFESFIPGSYFKGNLCCDITGSDPFKINYYLAGAPELDFWDTYVGDNIEYPFSMKIGYSNIKLVIQFNNGVITGFDKGVTGSNRDYTRVTFTTDYDNCEDGQIHLTATESDWNYVNYDLIIGYDSSKEEITLVSNKSSSSF